MPEEATTARVDFVTSAHGHTDFYSTADQVYVTVSDSLPNLTLAGSQTVQCSTVTVTNPSTGDQESVRVCETGPTSGIYTNTPTFSGFYLSPPGTPTTPSCGVAGTSPALSNTALDTAWVNNFALTADATDSNWLLTYNGGTSWTLSKESVSPVPIWTVTAGTAFSNDEMSFTLLQQPSPNAPVAGTTISLCVYGKRPLPTTTSTGVTGALTPPSASPPRGLRPPPPPPAAGRSRPGVRR